MIVSRILPCFRIKDNISYFIAQGCKGQIFNMLKG